MTRSDRSTQPLTTPESMAFAAWANSHQMTPTKLSRITGLSRTHCSLLINRKVRHNTDTVGTLVKSLGPDTLRDYLRAYAGVQHG